MTSTRLHIQILDEKSSFNQTKKNYRFSQKNYLVMFETSLIKDRRRILMKFELINNDLEDKISIKSNARIIEGKKKKKKNFIIIESLSI